MYEVTRHRQGIDGPQREGEANVRGGRLRGAHIARIARRTWRLRALPGLAAALALLGLVVGTYPSMAQWFSQYNQSKIVESYSRVVSSGLTPSAAEQFREAREYNDALAVGALLDAHAHVPTGSGTESNASLDYESILSVGGTGLMGRITIPVIKVDLPIYHGTSDEILLQGVGHLQGTSLPVGGTGTHAVLTGHRGLANAEMFTHLDKVKTGDTFILEILGEALTYRVVDIKIVEPEEKEALRALPGRDLVTLVTCTPLGINSQRILVTGERLLPTPVHDVESVGAEPEIPGFPWWALIQALGVVLIAVHIWRSGLESTRGSREDS